MLVLLLFLNLSFALSRAWPQEINRCRKSDPDFNSCLDKSATEAVKLLKNGNGQIGVAPLEPFVIDKVDVGNVSSGAINLHQVYTNMNLFGMTDTVLSGSNANFTGDNCFWHYNCFTPLVRMEADYRMKGQMFLFPINGRGKCTNHLYGINGTYRATCERYQKKNRTHLRINDFSFVLKPQKIVFGYENLFEGNEQLSKEIVKALNENAEDVYAEVGPSFNEVMATVWKAALNRVFSKIPEDQLFLP